MYKIDYSKDVIKFLEIRDKKFQKKFFDNVEILAQNPYQNSLDIKKLESKFDNKFRLRIGKYRFLYEINNNEVLIYFYKAGSRGDIYK